MAARKRRRTRRKRKGHYHTGVHISPKSGQECKYRSGWELEFMKWLDAEDNVVTYRYEDVAIPYVSNVRTGKTCRYFPDFLVTYRNESQVLIEIKPAKRVPQANVQKKLKAAEVWCREHQVTLVVLTEVELKGLGLLK